MKGGGSGVGWGMVPTRLGGWGQGGGFMLGVGARRAAPGKSESGMML